MTPDVFGKAIREVRQRVPFGRSASNSPTAPRSSSGGPIPCRSAETARSSSIRGATCSAWTSHPSPPCSTRAQRRRADAGPGGERG